MQSSSTIGKKGRALRQRGGFLCHKSIKWRADQRALIDAGRWDKAMKMDIDECRRKFGSKYDTHIADMISSLENNRKFQKMLTKRGWTIDYDILK